MGMQLQINGETQEVPPNLTLSGLVAHLELRPERVAVELNKQIVKRSTWKDIELSEGDTLEIVHFVGGGSLIPGLIRDN